MTTPIASTANVQQQQIQACDVPVYNPSYNAVQINMDTPTVNAPQMAPLPDTATHQWTA